MSYKNIKEVKGLLKVARVENDPNKHSRDTYWTMFDGHQVKVRNMEDHHLLNTIHFIRTKIKILKRELNDNPMLDLLIEEVNLRGLDIKLADTQQPFMGNDGKLKIWDNLFRKYIDY